MNRELAEAALAEVEQRAASGTTGKLSSEQLLAIAGVRATLALIEPAPVAVELRELLSTVDAEELERVALERVGERPGSLTELMLGRLVELADER